MASGADCENGADLTVSINTFGDSETGSWGSAGCLDDEVVVLPATVMACPTAGVGSPQVLCDNGAALDLFVDTAAAQGVTPGNQDARTQQVIAPRPEDGVKAMCTESHQTTWHQHQQHHAGQRQTAAGEQPVRTPGAGRDTRPTKQAQHPLGLATSHGIAQHGLTRCVLHPYPIGWRNAGMRCRRCSKSFHIASSSPGAAR